MTLRILNAEPYGYSEEAKVILRRLGSLEEKQLLQSELPQAVANVDVLIVRLGLEVSREVLELSRRLKVIVSATTGIDHIDLAEAAKRGITVLTLKGETAFLESIHSTAEHTWGLLLALVRKIPWAFDSVRTFNWDRDSFRGQDLSGKRLGILGFGRIGARVASYGRAFDMDVVAYTNGGAPPRKGVTFVESIDDLLANSDILSIHIPLNEKTRGLIDQTRLSQLPRGSLLVNTSRGAILDEAALLHQLQVGVIAGAALDVIANETADLADTPLIQYAKTHENLLVTPHLGGATEDSMNKAEVFIAHKLEEHLSGEKL